jgi:hypothetical protein
MAEVTEGMPLSEYLALPRVSASDVKNMLVCAKWAQYNSWLNPKRPPMTSTDAQGIGSLAHELLLEGSAANVQIIKPEDHPSKQTKKDDPPKIPKGWTNDSIRAARDSAIAAGMIPVLPWDMYAVTQMVDSAKEFIESLKDTEPAIWAMMQPGGGKSEVTLIWDENGVPCRIRCDRLSTDNRIVLNYKTTTGLASPEVFTKQMVRMDFHTDGAFYMHGVEAVTGILPTHLWLIQEQNAPYMCSIAGMEWESTAHDIGWKKAEFGLSGWRTALKSGVWPGYPNRVAHIELPPWEVAEWEEL